MIRCRLLGPVEVTSDGGPAPQELLWRKNLALLVYLARSPRGRTRDHLVGLLWPEKQETQARHSLNEALRVLRRALGEDAVQSDARQVRVVLDAMDLDTDRFESLTGAGRWRDAATLFLGDFLEGFGVPGASDFEDWLRQEREAWRRHGVQALARAAGESLTAGDLKEAAGFASRALGFDPLAEGASRALMRVFALNGERAAALAEFERLNAGLSESRGVVPEAETGALAERIRRGRGWNLAPDALESANAYSRRAPLVARSKELGRLLEAWTACREQKQGTIAIIEGDTGTGKTRLLEELLDRARLDRASVAAVRAVEADSTEPFATLVGLARGGMLDMPGLSSASPQSLGVLAARIPEWADRFTPSQENGLASGRAFIEVLGAIVQEQPVLLAIDDLQWSDRDSILTLAAALRDCRAAPLLLVATTTLIGARPEIDDLRVRVPRDVPGAVVKVEALKVEAIYEMAHWALPRFTETELDRVARRVAMDSAGLPLLVVELLHAVSLGLDLRESEAAWPSPLRTLTETLPGDLPDAVVAAIRIGFRRLTQGAQRVLAAAAVLEDRVTPGDLSLGSALEGEALHLALDELEWQRWLVAEPRGYSFVARVARDVVARDMVTPGQRKRIIDTVRKGYDGS
ncbi:MAG TPA: AAA family ATPase [Gemmatimonadales bacterium]|nr:AAA family ATPase [Gemmatimonadales bacterium]